MTEDKQIKWNVKKADGKIYSEVDTAVLHKWIQENRILKNDYIWDRERKEWVYIKSMSLFANSIEQAKKYKAYKETERVTRETNSICTACGYIDRRTRHKMPN